MQSAGASSPAYRGVRGALALMGRIKSFPNYAAQLKIINLYYSSEILCASIPILYCSI